MKNALHIIMMSNDLYLMYLIMEYKVGHADDDLAFRWACINGHLEVVKYLVANGANINIYKDFTRDSMHLNTHLDVVEYLKQHISLK